METAETEVDLANNPVNTILCFWNLIKVNPTSCSNKESVEGIESGFEIVISDRVGKQILEAHFRSSC